ncbi:MAG: NAD-dependent epimerase/dehydratase family protein [Chlamydiae bacterium]|nr:NAD-dependent epimerase/dehydratase family protein [Chlamydiota bacterium]
MGLGADDLIVITGGAGFIAKYVIRELNRLHHSNIVLFDRYDLLKMENFHNLHGLKFSSLESSDVLEEFLEVEKSRIRCVIHLGANSSTTGKDSKDYLIHNYELSKLLADFCVEEEIRFIYASSASIYGDGKLGFSDDRVHFEKYKPLNLYAWSKYLFDQYILENHLEDQVLGLRLFNVFGADRSKEEMRCIVTRAHDTISIKKKMEIFDIQADRDFVYAGDVACFIVESITKDSHGIVNFGTAETTSFKQMCDYVYSAMGQDPNFSSIALPEHLIGKYQHVTLSDPKHLNAMIMKFKYNFRFTAVKEAVEITIRELNG